MGDHSIRCPRCSKSLKVPTKHLGRMVKCPGCQGKIQLLPKFKERKVADGNTYTCPKCGGHLVKGVGTEIACKHCSHPIAVPSPPSPPSLSEPSDASPPPEDGTTVTVETMDKTGKPRTIALGGEFFDAAIAEARRKRPFPTKVAHATPQSYAAKWGLSGATVGIAFVFAVPRMPSLIASAIVGAVLAAAGSAVGCVLGSCVDVMHERVPEKPDRSSSEDAAIVSFALGLVCCVAWLLPIAGIPLGVAALLTARAGRFSCRRGLAVTGMWMGLVCLLLGVGNGLLGAMLNVLENR